MPKSRYNRNTTTTKGSNQHVTVVILNAGMPRRMRSYSARAMFPYSERKTVIQHHLETIRRAFSNFDLYLTVGYQAQRIIEHCPSPIRIVEDKLHEENNTAEELRLTLNLVLSDRVLLLQCETIFQPRDLKKMTEQGRSTALIDQKGHLSNQEMGLTVNTNNRVTFFSYGLEPKWGQATFLTGEELSLVRKLSNERKRHKQYVFEIFNDVIDNGGEFQPVTASKLFRIASSADIPVRQ